MNTIKLILLSVVFSATACGTPQETHAVRETTFAENVIIRTEFNKYEYYYNDIPITRDSQNSIEQIYQNVDTYIYNSYENARCGPIDRFNRSAICPGDVFGDSEYKAIHMNDMGILQTEELHIDGSSQEDLYTIRTSYSGDCVLVSRESDACVRKFATSARITVTGYNPPYTGRNSVIFKQTFCIDFQHSSDEEYVITKLAKNEKGFFIPQNTTGFGVRIIGNTERCE